MRSALSELEVVRPRDLAHALTSLHESLGGERLTPLAGGTDLFVHLNAGTHRGTRFLDLHGLRELRGIRAGARVVTIGAGVTFRDIGEHAVIRRRFPSLAAAASVIGAWQIQNRATLGGNIANASPAGDSLPVLLAHDAVILARSVRGERRIDFGGLYRGYRELALEPDEIITAVELPNPPARVRAFFRKVGTRRAQSISKVVACGLLRSSAGGKIDHVRLAYGSVAPVPLRALHAEETLLGAKPTRAVLAATRAALLTDISPIDDIRSDRDYRLAVAGNLLEQFLRGADARFARGENRTRG